MNKFHLTLAAITLVALIGCDKKTDTTAGNAATTTKVSALNADVCGKCGCCEGCEDCCNAEVAKCSCGFNKGSLLCCVEGVEPSDATYCKMCGHEKGSESCCAEGNEKCEKCGMAKGAPLCCKLKDQSVSVDSKANDENGADHHHDEDGDHHDADHGSEGDMDGAEAAGK